MGTIDARHTLAYVLGNMESWNKEVLSRFLQQFQLCVEFRSQTTGSSFFVFLVTQLNGMNGKLKCNS